MTVFRTVLLAAVLGLLFPNSQIALAQQNMDWQTLQGQAGMSFANGFQLPSELNKQAESGSNSELDNEVTATNELPNIVYIMSDELAYYELSHMGNEKLRTPNIDQMAREGMRFTQALSAAPVCGPTRAALMTGRHLGHCSVRTNGGGTPLRADEVTIASMLKQRGYTTGGFGKWGAGGRGSTGVPEKHGFDVFYGYYDQIHAHSFYPPYLIRNSEEVELEGNDGGREGQSYSHYSIMKEGLQFIKDHKDERFFCYLPITPPHGMYDIPADDPAWQLYEDDEWMKNPEIPQDAKNYAAMVSMIDSDFKRVLDLLKELSLDENTIVIFSGDNGGQDRFVSEQHPRGLFGSNVNPQTGVEFRGGKRSLYEGGLRIPFFVRWPGKIEPGKTSDLLFSQVDMMKTLAELTGSEIPPETDGLSILPTLLGEEAVGRKQEQHSFLYWEYEKQTAVRMNQWKAIRLKPDASWQLYDLAIDVSEQNNVAAQHADVLAQMKQFAVQSHTPAKPGTFEDVSLHRRDQKAKWGSKGPPKKRGEKKKTQSNNQVPTTLQLAGMFGNQMVLQRETEVAIWGTAKPGERVLIAPSWTDDSYLADVNDNGSWRTKIQTPSAGGPFTIAVSSGEEKIQLQDVLSGEVWICSGQSNMQWKLSGFGVEHFKEDVEQANYPMIRFCNVPQVLALEGQDDANAKWSTCSPRTALNFSAVAYFFGSRLYQELDVPIGLISTSWGGSSAEAWVSPQVLQKDFPEFNQKLGNYPKIAKKHGSLFARGTKAPNGLKQKSPSVLFNSMIQPVIPYTVRGVVWYQGEANVLEPEQYRALFPALIRDWRERWGIGDFPFYYVQIAPFAYKNKPVPVAFLREAQMMALSEPNTGMAVTMDIGNASNIHPKQKKPVGERLALLALARDYGKTELVDSGPLYQNFKIEGDKIRLEFQHVGSGLASRDDKALSHFTIAGADKTFVPANAVIDGESIVVSSASVAAPIAVRFAWGNADKPNLMNKDGLPASSFRTDAWAIESNVSSQTPDIKRPNIIVIYTDDQGYGDVSALNPNAKFKTPNIDRVANEGIAFTNGHSADSICTPSRYALLTGRYSWRTRMKQGVMGAEGECLIADGRMTLASLLHDNGYNTAMVGKWHLGMNFPGTRENRDWSQPVQNMPLDKGFDYFYGIPASLNYGVLAWFENRHAVVPPTLYTKKKANDRASDYRIMPPYNDGSVKQGLEVASDFIDNQCLTRFTDKAIEWMEGKVSTAKQGKPFFLYLPYTSPHYPVCPLPEFHGQGECGAYGEFMIETDHHVGRILNFLDANGLAENTLVVFTSDNGPERRWQKSLTEFQHDSRGGYREGKRSIYEGGNRVPFFVRWPAGIARPSRQWNKVVGQVDMLATFAELIGADLTDNAGEDSQSFASVLLDPNSDNKRLPSIHHGNGGGIRYAITDENWKLVLPNAKKAYELYNLADDPVESTNVADDNPEIVERLTGQINKIISQGRTTAGTPQTNDTGYWKQLAWLTKRQYKSMVDEAADDSWIIDSQSQWEKHTADKTALEIEDGLASPKEETATFQSTLKTFDEKRMAQSIVFEQSPIWQNWEPVENVGPTNLRDAPVLLSLGPDNYWMFGMYGKKKVKQGQAQPTFESETATLDGFDIPLKTSPFPNQFNARGGLKEGLGGYHAWQSRDMINWVHHGPVTEGFSRWVTTAEYVDGRVYIYYDYPNDQDPHLYIDEDLTDGVPGKNMGIAFKDPSHGSDCNFIRDLEGNFHVIYEDWSPINASKRSWDSPLAGHAVSKDGIKDFEILKPAIDNRTTATGKTATYKHPHWASHPDWNTNIGEYQVHEPEQEAYGDWASVCIGGQYYLFGDFDPVGGHKMSVGWFTSSNLNEPFTWCDKIGEGHPDPDIGFAEGKFYLVTQQKIDYTSPGPWVETIEARVGVDTTADGKVDHWGDWQTVKETYDYTPGFAKQIKKKPASIDLSDLPEGFGFQFEVKLTDTTENKSKPTLDIVTVSFAK